MVRDHKGIFRVNLDISGQYILNKGAIDRDFKVSSDTVVFVGLHSHWLVFEFLLNERLRKPERVSVYSNCLKGREDGLYTLAASNLDR